ncbi:DeoR/GlpR family DNA-binding transcription regulator [Corynebacterium uropygiale]|uniref:Lactose phosphotransferase system repressor n=1 Tax=Corynebacterium uropygiale TaxID=1775911 RepID=A0A9X1QQA0_9CORY|nr:DeoR/GlpR family DNA-binding transcription regulator [Corynebacterium uropygiale]MCF4006235.1 DeoR/GlpR family DNA-binding transcription regulator [Corynebacterium uropygiale]
MRKRQQDVLAFIRSNTEVSVAELGPQFGVSMETIRRDLRVLEERGDIERTYGRVRAVGSSLFEIPHTLRQDRNIGEKRRIATAALDALDDASTIFIDEGHLPYLLALALPRERELTAVTSSLPTAQALATLPKVTSIVLGGVVRGISFGVIDHWAVTMLESMNIDVAFIGANGIDSDGWLSTPNPQVASVKKKAIEQARRRVFIGDHSKFDARSFVRFAHISSFHRIITGAELRESTARRYSRWDVPLHRVEQ